jgi:thiamine biosynthesis lipoprotein
MYGGDPVYVSVGLIIAAALCFLSSGCEGKREHLIQGRTMGTTYHIKVVTGYFQGVSGLKEKIEKRLVDINDAMSTYQKDSEISRFNEFNKNGRKFKISDDFYRVMKTAQAIYRLSDGAWDGTVNPLVDLWGFGKGGAKNRIPLETKISELLSNIGFENIEILEPGFLLKKRAAVTLDLSSIAKGYGVDQVADTIRKEGFQHYLVEIGGEVFASGYRKDGMLWRIGINRPQTDAAFDEVYKVVNLHNKAFATSGDYRNFFVVDGIRYAHIIDPRTGYPISNGVVSVTIIADTCTFADGLATAIMVMGPEKGLDLINRLDAVEGLIIVEQMDGSLVDFFSKGFSALK